MRYKYEVDENNILRIWDLEQPYPSGDPLILQPDFPDATPWNKDQATEWANDWIEMMTNPDHEFLPRSGPSAEKNKRKIEE